MSGVVLNPLLQNEKINEAHIVFAKKQTKAKYARIKVKYDEMVNGIKQEPKTERLTIYKMKKSTDPEQITNNRGNMYVSALNTGKLKKVNPEKVKEYNIIFDEINNKFIRKKS